ncbi:MAG: tRNA (guanine-N1)-methyltransferase [Desulfurococcales archaeon]|nr:tRNA (guanine-N1)-methyltransferase [Desulfurococcales archaeon]
MTALLRPGDALAALLVDLGVDRVAVLRPVNRRRLAELGLQELAVEMLVEELDICASREPVPCRVIWEGRGVAVAVPGKGGSCRYVVGLRNCLRRLLSWRTLREALPANPLPAFVVDLSRLSQHSDEERASLKIQLAMTLTVVRRFLWDPHLILTSAPENAWEWLYPSVGKSKIQVRGERPGRVLWNMNADKVVILRPDAEKVLSEDDIRDADAFLVGGIVDKIPRPGVSRFLDTAVPWGKPRRIELRGSLVGVPDRINRIAEIVFKVRFEGMTLEKAIISSMTRRDVLRRLQVEILRASKGGRLALDRDHYEMLSRWLPVSCRDYLDMARRSGVEVGWECEG